MTDLEGRELDEALVHALGWATWRETGAVTDAERRTLYWGIPEWHASLDALLRDIEPVCRDGQQWLSAEVPEWHTSLDALLRDIEPVCRERGMLRLAIEQVGEERWEGCARMASGLRFVSGYGPTAATALARAFLAVLTRGRVKRDTR